MVIGDRRDRHDGHAPIPVQENGANRRRRQSRGAEDVVGHARASIEEGIRTPSLQHTHPARAATGNARSLSRIACTVPIGGRETQSLATDNLGSIVSLQRTRARVLIPSASKTASAFASVSSYSLSGTLSDVTAPPTWTESREPSTTAVLIAMLNSALSPGITYPSAPV